MLRLIGFLIRLTVMAVIILALGNIVEWRGRTISDQVKIQISQAERSAFFTRVREVSAELVQDSTSGQKKNTGVRSTREEIPVSERQKLKALIRELNGGSGTN